MHHIVVKIIVPRIQKTLDHLHIIIWDLKKKTLEHPYFSEYVYLSRARSPVHCRPAYSGPRAIRLDPIAVARWTSCGSVSLSKHASLL